MRKGLIIAALGALLTSCSPPPGNPTDANSEQGNPNAKPEKDNRSSSNKQPSDEKSGKDVHTGLPDKGTRQ